MALYLDGPPSSIEDLAAQDSQVLAVSATENIDLTAKLALAHEQVRVELEGLVRRLLPADRWRGTQSFPRIDCVVVTRPLRLLHTFRTLKLVYTDAYYNQLNDRYERKRDEFDQQAKWAYERLIEAGIGMTMDPISAADAPGVSATPGALPAGTYYAAICWVNAAGEEGSPSIPASIELSGQTLAVQPVRWPSRAIAWNVYVGIAPDRLIRQNLTPIVPGDKWLQPDALANSGALPGDGQHPAYFYSVPRLIQRG